MVIDAPGHSLHLCGFILELIAWRGAAGEDVAILLELKALVSGELTCVDFIHGLKGLRVQI